MPTSRGWAAAAAGVVLLAAGFALGFSQLVLLGWAAVGAVVGGCGYARRAPALQASREVLPLRVERGSAAVGALTVTAKRRTAPVRLVETCGDEPVPVRLPSLARGATHVVTYRLPTRRRGVVAVGPLVATRSDPFGLATHERRYGDLASLWVHPRAVDLGAPASGRMVSLEGVQASDATDGTLTFSSLREYVPGDDPRRIHWRTSARTGVLTTRQFVDTSLPTTTVVLDDRVAAYPDADAFEEAVDAAASVLVSCARRKQPALLRTPGGTAYDGTGRADDVRQLLDRLARVPLQEPSELAAAVDALPRSRRGSSLVLVTGAAGPADLAGVLRVRRRFARLVVARFGIPEQLPALDLGDSDRLDCADVDEFAHAWRVLAR